MSSNSVLHGIAIHATANTALPTLAAQGANIDWTSTTPDFTFIGTMADTVSQLALKEDSVTRGFDRVYSEIKSPTGGAPEDYIVSRISALPFEFTVWSGRDTLLALDSNFDTGAETFITDSTYTTTKRTVCVEINGQGVMYYPQCVVAITQAEGAVAGDDAANVYTVQILPESTTNQPMGVEFHEYQAA